MATIINKMLIVPFILLLSCSSNSNKHKPATQSSVIATALTVTNNHLFKISIDRKVKGASCTQGYILINGVVIAYSLELPDVNNQDYISSIPKGTYDAKIRTDGAKGWRIELQDVPSRENVQIHVGNFTSEIEGCILIGTKVDLDNCNVTNTYRHEAMKKLQNKFNEFTTDLILNQGSTSPINIEVEISGI